jgi:hypothetical protein
MTQTRINNRTVAIHNGPARLFEREFMIPPATIRIFNNAQGGPYKYCYPENGKLVSFPLPCTREILLLVEQGKL